MNESVESVRREDEEVSGGDPAPPSQHEVTTQALLKDPRQVLVEQAVKPVGVRVTQVSFQLGVETSVARV